MNDITRSILDQFARGTVPETIPSDLPCAEELKHLAEYLVRIQHFTISLANGDLTASLKGVGGPVAGSLKSLQASLRHLTWQTRQIAAGDLSQRVDFMGEFSTGFNAMVVALSEARSEMESMNVRLQEELCRQREMAETLRHKEERFRLIAEKANAVIWTIDAVTGRFTFVGPRITKLRGLTVEEALAETFEESLAPVSRQRVSELMAHKKARFLESGDASDFFDCIEVEQVCKDGRIIQVEMVISAITDNDGNLKEYLGISRDITDRKAMENELTYLSSHDSLTGLYNRVFFDKALNKMAEKENFPLSIVVADLDGLKLINDTLGHAAGDQLIKNAASVLRAAFRASDAVARTGGDEFVALLQGTGEDEAAGMLERVRSCEAHFNQAHHGPPLRISLGVATAQRGEEVAQALALADNRMYADKSRRKQKMG